MSWLEAEPKESGQPATRAKSARAPAQPPNLRGAAARRDTLQVRAEWLLDSIPPIETAVDEGVEGVAKARRYRNPQEPPTLPPPPANAVRVRGALPPPLPREEAPPPRSSRRPPKR